MNKSFNKKTRKTLLLYNVFFVLAVSTFCFFLPRILSYPPNSVNTEFERHIDMGFNYNVQCVVTVILIMLISNAIFALEIRKVKNWEKYVNSDSDDEVVEKIKKNCFSIPNRLYVIHALVPPIVTYLGLLAVRN